MSTTGFGTMLSFSDVAAEGAGRKKMDLSVTKIASFSHLIFCITSTCNYIYLEYYQVSFEPRLERLPGARIATSMRSYEY